MRSLDIIPQQRHREGPRLPHPCILVMVLPTLKADFAICETYDYVNEGPLECPISVFGGIDDQKVCYGDLAPWCEQAEGLLKIRILPATTFSCGTHNWRYYSPFTKT